MSKVSNEEKSMIDDFLHVQSNVCGNKQGRRSKGRNMVDTPNQLLSLLASCCSTSKPPCILHKVKVLAPIEFGPSGK